MKNQAIHSAVLDGIEAVSVDVECAISDGLPGISIIGMSDAAILETRCRIRCALRQAGFQIPRAHIVLNLTPSDLVKTSTTLDLAMAVAILNATGQIPSDGLDNTMFVGELGLYGNVVNKRGVYSFAELACKQEHAIVCAMDENSLISQNFNYVEDPAYFRPMLFLKSLSELRTGIQSLPSTASPGAYEWQRGIFSFAKQHARYPLDYDYVDIYSNEHAKRALMIAAVGKHNVLLVGDNIEAKTLGALIHSYPWIQPRLDDADLDRVLKRRILNVARSCADLNKHEFVQIEDVCEALAFRPAFALRRQGLKELLTGVT